MISADEARVAAAEERGVRPLALRRAACGARRPDADAAVAGDEALVAATQLPPRRGGRGGAFGRLLAHGGPLGLVRSALCVDGRTRAAASVANSSGVAVPSSTKVLPPASVVSAYGALPSRRRVAVVVERPLDAVDRDRAGREGALQQPGDPGGVRVEPLVHADVLVARRDVADVPGGDLVDVATCAARRRWPTSRRGATGHGELVVGRDLRLLARPRRRRRRVRIGVSLRGTRSTMTSTTSRLAPSASDEVLRGLALAVLRARSRPCGRPSPRASRRAPVRRRCAAALLLCHQRAPASSDAAGPPRPLPPAPRRGAPSRRPATPRSGGERLAALPQREGLLEGRRSPARARSRRGRARRAPARS